MLVAAGLTAIIIWQADPREVGRHLADLDWRYAGAAVMLVLVDRTLMALRWIALLAPLAPGTRPSIGALMRIFFVSTFLGTVLPMSVGADAVRAWGLSRAGITTHESLASVLMDRLLGVVSLLLMAAVGLMVVPALAGNSWVLLAMAATLGACALGLAAVFSAGLAVAGHRWLERLPEGRVRRGAVRMIDALQAYRRHRGVAAGVLAASVAVQVLRILQAWLLGLSLGITAGAAAYFAFVPLILLIMMLPITIMGLGTSQLAFAFFFAQAGVDWAPAVALSVLFIALGVVGNLPGALLYAFRQRPV
ncbi:MAG TPA: lysylphosphatidylglycerol synthase transmembrane domain-containing protein [Vicinamibacterales bacterium]|nr:lysylphosphatidylglycerol synthase transmembrane domain-containing protein [Vicinamibacterales bacterium]